jgi:hypothetical protein
MTFLWFFMSLFITTSFYAAEDATRIIKNEFPSVIKRVERLIAQENYNANDLKALCNIIRAEAAVLNEMGLFAARAAELYQRDQNDILLPSDEIKDLVENVKKAKRKASSSVLDLFNEIKKHACGTYILEYSITYDEIERFVFLSNNEQREYVKKNYYDLLSYSFLCFRYEKERKISNTSIYAAYLLDVYQICITRLLYHYRTPIESLPNYFILPIYQLSFRQESSVTDQLYKFLYQMRMCMIKDMFKDILPFIQKRLQKISEEKKAPLLACLKQCHDILFPVAACSPSSILERSSYEIIPITQKTLYHIIKNDSPGSKGWFYSHAVFCNPDVVDDCKFLFDIYDFNNALFGGEHQVLYDMCRHVARWLGPVTFDHNEEAEKLIMQESSEKNKKRSAHQRRMKRVALQKQHKNNMVTDNESQEPFASLFDVGEQKNNYNIEILKDEIGQFKAHVNDHFDPEEQGDVEMEEQGLIYDNDRCLGFLDTLRSHFGGHVNKIFIFKHQSNERIAALLRNINYDYLRLRSQKIVNQADNNHAFSEAIERGYGQWALIKHEEALSQDDIKYMQQYGIFTHKIEMALPGTLTDKNQANNDIDISGPRGDFEFVLYYNNNDTVIRPLCVHRFYRPRVFGSKSARRKARRQLNNQMAE